MLKLYYSTETVLEARHVLTCYLFSCFKYQDIEPHISLANKPFLFSL